MTTNDVITEEETQATPRTLNELILLDTYQGMSDDEIEMVMEYRIQNALQGAEIDYVKETVTENNAKTLQVQKAMADDSARTNAALREYIESMKSKQAEPIKVYVGADIPIPNLGGDSVG